MDSPSGQPVLKPLTAFQVRYDNEASLRCKISLNNPIYFPTLSFQTK